MPDFHSIIKQFNAVFSPLNDLTISDLDPYGLEILIKRDDLIDPALSGNKWRKLHLNLVEAKRQGKQTLLTFGGAYSNHIYAVAAAGQHFGFKTIGIIRGEAPAELGATLRFAKSCGMDLQFISRTAYREKIIPNHIKIESCYVVPEGGSNLLGVKGCGAIVDEVYQQLEDDKPVDYWCLSSGTGGTASGIISQLLGRSKVLAFSALKGDFLKKEIQHLLELNDAGHFNNWQLISDYHFGGYAKHKPELIQFMNSFYEETGVPLDPVYTGKLLFGICDLAKKGFFNRGSRIVVVHTGGLQGLLGFRERFGPLVNFEF